MIQFNLLPDVKLQYIKTRRTKRLTMIISVISAAACLTLLILMFVSVKVVQKKHINDLSKDIKSQVKTLNNVQDLNKILTVQNQLNSLPDLHQNKPATS